MANLENDLSNFLSEQSKMVSDGIKALGDKLIENAQEFHKANCKKPREKCDLAFAALVVSYVLHGGEVEERLDLRKIHAIHLHTMS